MRNLKIKPFAYFVFALFAISFIGVALVTRAQISDILTALQVAYKTIPIILFLLLIFTTYAWKWKVFSNWLVPFPYLEGTWQGHILTTWKNPQTGESPGPIPTILTIKQSFSRISCVMRTGEMSSHSYLADFWLDTDEQIRKLGYCYTSSPSINVRDRSQPHDGTIVLQIVGDPVKRLHGIYWTTRKTTGEVNLTFRCRLRLDECPADLGEHPMINQ